MKVYAILLLVIHQIFAEDVETFNVGTVLFSPKDLRKDAWRLPELGLIRARRYFQYVLPPPSLVDPSINNFADSILDYFTEAINVIKREDSDALSTDILSVAMLDAIGGYLKSYILPVTKYGYYGGTVTQEDTQKLYLFYEDIKAILRTDGSGWKIFDGNFRKPLRIIATPSWESNRATRASCDQLAFYEETPTGLTVPLPFINFNNEAPVMFVPLKGHPLVCLQSRTSSDTLLKYYQAAKNCLKTRSPNSEAEFENRFQSWLTDDVIAHLDDDDHVYFALGGILTLANEAATKITAPKLIESPCAQHKPYIHINFRSKKVMILAVILFLEAVWCIPAILYMICIRKKKKKFSDTDTNINSLFFIKTNNNNCDKCISSSLSQTRSSLSSCDETTCESVRKFKKKYFRIQESRQSQNPSIQNVELQTSRVVSRSSKGTSNQSSKQCSTESCKEDIERMSKPIRSSLKKPLTPVFDVNPSNFKIPTMLESNVNIMKLNKRSNQQICSVRLNVNQDSRRPSRITKSSKENVASKSNDQKLNEKVLHKHIEETDVCQPRNPMLIQIETASKMEMRTSSKTLKSRKYSDEITFVCKSSNNSQNKNNAAITPAQETKDDVINSRKDEDYETFCSKTETSTIATQDFKGYSKSSIECHKPKDNPSLIKFQGDAIGMQQPHVNPLTLRKSDYNERIQRKSNQDFDITPHPEDAFINRNKSNDASNFSKSDDNAMILSNIDENSLGNCTDSEITSHIYNDNDTTLHDTPVALEELGETTRFRTDSKNALATKNYNVDYETKDLRNSTQELQQLIDKKSSKAYYNEVCDCTLCLTHGKSESCTKLRELRTCATMTLITDDNSSEKSVQSLKTVCSKCQESVTPASNPSRPFINTSLVDKVDSHQTKSRTKLRSGALTPILKTSKLNNEPTSSIQKSSASASNAKENITNDFAIGKTEKSVRNYGFKIYNRKLFECKIEKPRTTINVDIETGKRKAPKAPKTSKIPRVIKDNVVRFDDRVSAFHRKPLEAPMGSRIPIPVKKTVDDIVIRSSRSKVTTPDPRLNVTL